MSDAGQAVAPLVVREEIDAALLSRLNNSRDQYIHIRGAPGSGKTSWAKMLCAAGSIAGADGDSLAVVAAAHFCSRNSAASGSDVRFLEHIAQKLSDYDSAFRAASLDRARRRRPFDLKVDQEIINSPGSDVTAVKFIIRGDEPEDFLEDLFTRPLRVALEGPGPIWLILVDAPDEPAETGVAKLLKKLGELPSRLRILVTSRTGTPFTQSFRLDPNPIDLSELSTEHSIRHFVDECLESKRLGARVIETWSLEDLSLALVERSKGNFLVAACTIDALVGYSGRIDAPMVDQLPTTLGGFYLGFLDQLPDHLRDAWPEQLGRLLGALAVARGPLSEEELARVTKLPLSVVHARLGLVRQYLRVDEEDRWSVYHATFAEFLLNKRDSGPFWCPEEEQHQRFIDWALPKGKGIAWSETSPYTLRHLIHHILAVEGESFSASLWAILSGEYVSARFQIGHQAHELGADFRRALAVVASRGAVELSFFLTLLVQLWNQKSAMQVEAASTSLLAAMGRVAEASALALRQDDAANASLHHAASELTSYIGALAALGEYQAALDLLNRAPAESRVGLGDAFLDALSTIAPEQALPFLRNQAIGSEPRHLSVDACRRLAELPEGAEHALAAEHYRQATLLAAAEGIAHHDLDRALNIVAEFKTELQWVGGEKIELGRDQARERVLSAYLASPQCDVVCAWERAGDLFGNRWPEPYGLSLAGDFAAADPSLASLAVERVMDPYCQIQVMLAFAWMSDRCQTNVTTTRGWRPTYDVAAISSKMLAWPSPHLRTVLPQLATFDARAMPRDPSAVKDLRVFADVLLAALATDTDFPELKSNAGKPLGLFFAWLGQDKIVAFREFAQKYWYYGFSLGQAAEGVATGAAYRGIDEYLSVISQSVFPEAANHWGKIAAAKIIADRDPIAAVRLFDVVEPQNTGTQAALAGIIAIAMRRSGVGRVEDLLCHLSRFVDGETFRYIVDHVETGIVGQASEDAENPTERAVALLEKAISSGAALDRLRAARAIEAVPADIGIVIQGETIWSHDLRRRFSRAFISRDPAEALRLVLPHATFTELQSLARAFLGDSERYKDAKNAADALLAALLDIEPKTLPIFWNLDVALAFALEFEDRGRADFLSALAKDNSTLIDRVLSGCDAVERPAEFLASFAQTRFARTAADDDDLTDGMVPEDLWQIRLAVRTLARVDPHGALSAVDAMALSDAFHNATLVDIAETWPASRWREAIDTFQNRVERLGEPKSWIFEFIVKPLCARVSATALRAVLGEIESIAGRFGVEKADFLLKEIVKARAALPIEIAEWRSLLGTIRHISEPGPREIALEHLLSAARCLRERDREAETALVLSEVGLSHRDVGPLLASGIGKAASDAMPQLRERWPYLKTRLRELLARDQLPRAT
ncbi:hypothetical protein [Jiella marina]|uniref:hypothetical protein n=1 Tax=Jiella sp. LLJ827 TaxID=2917712 RepID=UPI002101BB7E|nr:hypothetical protein [Jiella sp. LLJ827]MCQ0987164.1 hypothetical protein [Jiella sp. LLJ827]